MSKTLWKSANIDGCKIWEHNCHRLTVDAYYLGDGTLSYALTCEYCQEVICSADPGDPDYRILHFLHDIYMHGYRISFDREGGRYGWVGYEKEGKFIRVAKSKHLV